MLVLFFVYKFYFNLKEVVSKNEKNNITKTFFICISGKTFGINELYSNIYHDQLNLGALLGAMFGFSLFYVSAVVRLEFLIFFILSISYQFLFSY